MTDPTIEIHHETDPDAITAHALDTIDVVAPYVGRDVETVVLPIGEAIRRALKARQPRRAIWRLSSPAARADARTWRAHDLAVVRHLIRLARGGAQTARLLWIE